MLRTSIRAPEVISYIGFISYMWSLGYIEVVGYRGYRLGVICYRIVLGYIGDTSYIGIIGHTGVIGYIKAIGYIAVMGHISVIGYIGVIGYVVEGGGGRQDPRSIRGIRGSDAGCLLHNCPLA